MLQRSLPTIRAISIWARSQQPRTTSQLQQLSREYGVQLYGIMGLAAIEINRFDLRLGEAATDQACDMVSAKIITYNFICRYSS